MSRRHFFARALLVTRWPPGRLRTVGKMGETRGRRLTVSAPRAQSRSSH
jgi:hypothetical protein